jgi:hypothetical protein
MKRLITGIALAVLLSVPALVAMAATTVVVSPSDSQGWSFVVETGSGAGSFVNGPAGPPAGTGSARLTTSTMNGGVIVAAALFGGTRLDQITNLEYSTYVAPSSTSNVQAIALQFNIDNDLTDADNGFKGRLVWEPYFTETVVKGTWQTWDPTTQGKWWGSNVAISGSCSQAVPCTWAQVLSAFPDAGIHGTFGAVILKAGSGWPAGFDGNVDALTIGVDGDDTTFDFEANNCQFAVSGTTMTLLADCTTTATISIPNGFTLDGNGYSITAEDPASGTFTGAVVRNAGAEAHVTNLTVRADGLAIACHASSPVDLRLRGILFDGASGSITYSTVDDINQGASGCQEGNAIEVRNAPFDGTHPNTQTVEVAHNVVTDYQKGGIIANGDVEVSIHHNQVGASATQANLAANAVQIGFGGGGEIVHNQIAGNSWCCESAAATAVLLFDTAPGVVVSKNNIGGNADIGIYIFTDDAIVDNNKVFESGADGFYDIGIGNYGDGSSVTNNKVGGYDTPYEGVSDGNNKAVPSSQ